MEEFDKFIKEFINNLTKANIPESQIYTLIGVNSILSSYKIRMKLHEIDYYNIVGGRIPENLEEIKKYNISEDPSSLQLSESALRKHSEYLKKLLLESIKLDEINPPNLNKIINELEAEVLEIDPEDIILTDFYTTLISLDSGLIKYEDIGRERVMGETKLSPLDIY